MKPGRPPLHRRRVLFPALLVVWLLTTFSRALAEAGTGRLEGEIGRTAARLQAIESQERAVPPPAVPLLTTYKHQLRDLITELVRSTPDARVVDLEQRYKAALARAGVALPALSSDTRDQVRDDATHPYGRLGGIDVRSPGSLENIRVITTSFLIGCDTDTSLYVFEKKGSTWRRTLDVESVGYTTVGQALGTPQWAINRIPGGGWFLVFAEVNPRCNSNWQSLRWTVLHPGSDPTRPHVLDRQQATIYLGDAEPFHLTASEGAFQLSWNGDELLYPDGGARMHVLSARVTQHHVIRTAPVAADAEGFVDEWAALPWNDARRWIVPAARTSARKWHDLLSRVRTQTNARFVTFFDSAEQCRQPGNRWQVVLDFDPISERDRLPPGTPDELLFSIAQRGTDFQLLSVSTGQPAVCPKDGPR
jgi:hypothetical protein